MNDKIRGGLFVLVGACSFGVLSTIVKTTYAQGYTLGHITGSQTFFGMIFLWAMYFLQSRAKRNTGLVGIFYYQCVKLLPASIAIILLMQYLWISIVIEAIVFRKRPTGIQVLAVCIVFVGTAFAAGIFNNTLSLNPKGISYSMSVAALA